MDILRVIDVAQRAADETEKGLVLTVGFVRNKNGLQFVCEVNRWDAQLIEDVKSAHVASRNGRVKSFNRTFTVIKGGE